MPDPVDALFLFKIAPPAVSYYLRLKEKRVSMVIDAMNFCNTLKRHSRYVSEAFPAATNVAGFANFLEVAACLARYSASTALY